MSFDRCGDEGKGIATLLATGLDDRQHRLDKTTARYALRPEGKLPPDRT